MTDDVDLPARRAPRRLALAALVALALGAAPAVAATDEPDATPAARIAVHAREAAAADARMEATADRRRSLAADRADTEVRLTAAEVSYLERVAAADAAAAAVDAARADLQAVAVAMYQASDGGNPALDAIALGTDPLEADRRRRLASFAGRAERQAWQQAQADARTAARAVEVADGLRRDLRARAETLAREVVVAASAEADARFDAAAAQRRLDRWLSVQAGPGTPILDRSRLTAAELAGWYASSRRTPRTTVPIETLAQLFVEEGERAGVRGDIAFAQSVLETAYFTFPDHGQVRPEDNNFAGIGACDSCPNGRSYPDARTGVRAQVQLLRAYADREVSEARLGAPPVDPRLTQLGFRGQNTTWASLTGRWATAAHYGDAIMAVYYRMLDWVTARG